MRILIALGLSLYIRLGNILWLDDSIRGEIDVDD